MLVIILFGQTGNLSVLAQVPEVSSDVEVTTTTPLEENSEVKEKQEQEEPQKTVQEDTKQEEPIQEAKYPSLAELEQDKNNSPPSQAPSVTPGEYFEKGYKPPKFEYVKGQDGQYYPKMVVNPRLRLGTSSDEVWLMMSDSMETFGWSSVPVSGSNWIYETNAPIMIRDQSYSGPGTPSGSNWIYGFCIQPTVPIYTGDKWTTVTADEQTVRSAIRGNMKVLWASALFNDWWLETHTNLDFTPQFVANYVIWDYLGVYNVDRVIQGNGQMAGIDTQKLKDYMADYKKYIDAWGLLPIFDKDPAVAQSVAVGKSITYNVTNGVDLRNYAVKTNGANVNYSISTDGKSITFTPTSNSLDGTITFERKGGLRCTPFLYSDPNKQNMLSAGLIDPVMRGFNLRVLKEGKLRVQKRSTENGGNHYNSNYSFAGAEYKVYTSNADAVGRGGNNVDTVTTDASGMSGYTTATLEYGKTYYVIETKAPTGYLLSNTVYTVTINDT